MLRNTYSYENRMLPNKVKCSIIWGVKGKDSVMLVKSLLNTRVGRGTLRYRSKKIGLSDQKV